MKDYSLAEQFALAGLNGQDSMHNTAAKKAVIKGIAMAEFLEKLLEMDIDGKNEEVSKLMDGQIQKLRKLNKKDREQIERDMAQNLKEQGVLTEIPDLLGCDIYYYTGKVTMREYKTAESVYQRITESVRAEILEDGDISAEAVCLLYLFRECGCIHDFFSIKEQEHVQTRLLACMSQDPFCRAVLSTEFHGIENIYMGFLKRKREFFKNPYLQGVNLIFPFLERRQAIFIEMILLGTDASGRRNAVSEFLRQNGHYVESVEFGGEYLLKIDNSYYRMVTAAARGVRIPVQGISLVPVYM